MRVIWGDLCPRVEYQGIYPHGIFSVDCRIWWAMRFYLRDSVFSESRIILPIRFHLEPVPPFDKAGLELLALRRQLSRYRLCST